MNDDIHIYIYIIIYPDIAFSWMTAQATFGRFSVGDEFGHRIVVPGMHMFHGRPRRKHAKKHVAMIYL